MIVLGYTFFEQDADAHEAGVSLRDRMLSDLCGVREARILRTDTGKPYLADFPDIFFSVSHTADLAVCALSFPGRTDAGAWTVMEASDCAPAVGADAEVLRPADQAGRLSRIAHRFFPEQLLRRLDNRTETEIPRIFAEEWTRCESYVKMTGQGFESGFTSLCFDGVCFPMLCLHRGDAEYVVRLAWRAISEKEEQIHG